ncbi:hypothetical protein V5O48_003977 [Marasmius crinis-equi]|uniref:Major facilitator superfamily (MFS) profile domain-containing protein n=1 Tax=Marasmius crinis-equi TaxID=585013 RepID=A0ABR3FRR9_9AGAR
MTPSVNLETGKNDESSVSCDGGTPSIESNASIASSPSPSTIQLPSNLVSEKPNPNSQVLSTVRLLLVHFGAALTLFLATTDATIISTMLPSLAKDLEANSAEYTWVGVAYMLTQTAFQPLYGKISDIVGRKNLLYVSIAIFAFGSLLCGLSQNITMLICSRALAGIGGGGIVSCVWVITSEIVEVRHRPKWSQALSITWSCSAIAGPLLGGAFSGSGSASLSWRWGFYLNLPICLIGFLVLWISLRRVYIQKAFGVSCRSVMKTFDFGGLTLFLCGTTCVIVGLSFAPQVGWNTPTTITLISSGLFVLAVGGVYEAKTTRESLFPPTLFKNLTAVTVLVIVFLHNFAFNAGTFYLALFYQAADGSTPFQAGIQMLPYSLGSSLASMPAAWFIGYWQTRSRNTSGQNWVIRAGLFVCTLGFGLLNLFDEGIAPSFRVLFPLIAGVGLGMLFHAPYQVFAKALKPCELATGTGAFFLVRFTGATTGLSVAGAIFNARVTASMPEEYSSVVTGPLDFGHLKSTGDAMLQASHAISLSIQLSLFLKKFPIDEFVERGSQTSTEKQSAESSSSV